MAPPQKWSKNASSSQYVTNEMLTPFISAPLPTSLVEMTLSCKNLLNTDIISKSDPYCIISMREAWQKKYFGIGRTETIDDNLNPEWVKKIILNYNFETIQKLKFEVRDEDLNGKYDFLGSFETTLSDIVSYSGRQFVGQLSGHNKYCGEIVIVTEEVITCKQTAQLLFHARDLKRLAWFGSNDPFLVISRSNEDGSYSVVTKTDAALSTQNPKWKEILIRVTSLCNGDYDRNIKIDCYDHRSSGNHKLIGTCFTSLRSLCAKIETELPLVNLEKQKKSKSNHKSSGTLQVVKVNLIEEFSFLDFIGNGTQLHFAVAIDFTASNGVYTDPNSLHYLCAARLNQYEIALRSVGEIIAHYDSSKLFPAFGFGAKLPTGQVSHQFPLNGNPSHPYCSGVEEILQYCRKTLQQAQLFGPTNFAPVINNTISLASQFQNGENYFVLLIITDGIISDMHQTKRAIINASTLPISIIIVGVGDADFDAMDELDSDDVRLSVDGRYAERDIVQFVPLNRFLSKSGPYVKSQADLAKEVLAEIPEQLTGFMNTRRYRPKNLQTHETMILIVLFIFHVVFVEFSHF